MEVVPASRMLKAIPSDPEGLSEGQIRAMQEVEKILLDLGRQNICETVVEPYWREGVAQGGCQYREHCERILAYTIAAHPDLDPIQQQGAEEVLSPRELKLGWQSMPCLFWSFAQNSFWRGFPENALVRKLMRSILIEGMRQAEPLIARSKDAELGLVLMGDGSARAAASICVWKLLLDSGDLDPALARIALSLLRTPVVFQVNGGGSPKETIIAQITLQNQRAQCQPVSTFQWITLTLTFSGRSLGNATRAKEISDILGELTSSYNNSCGCASYTQAPAKLSKRARRQSLQHDKRVKDETTEVKDETDAVSKMETDAPIKPDQPDSIMLVSRRRLKAMTVYLSNATPESYKLIQEHIGFTGGWQNSAVNDDILGQKWFYPNSKLGKPIVPVPQLQSHADAAKTGDKMYPMYTDTPLTKNQFHLMLQKGMSVHERRIAHLSEEAKARNKPSEAMWKTYRLIVQRYDETISKAAKDSMSEADFKNLEDLILRKDTYDLELDTLIEKGLPAFSMTMLSFVEAETTSQTDATKVWEAKKQYNTSLFDVFEVELRSDWDKLEELQVSSQKLRDLLLFKEIEHTRAQGAMGEQLIERYMAEHFLYARANDWESVPASVAFEVGKLRVTGKKRFVIVLDFNVVGMRNKMKMGPIVECVYNMCVHFGSRETLVLLIPPVFDQDSEKQEETSNADTEKFELYRAFRRHGFIGCADLRMMLDFPDSAKAYSSQLPWFADIRAYTFCSLDESFWAQSELIRTRIVTGRPQLPSTIDLLLVTDVDNEGIDSRLCAKKDLNERVAQRGPEFWTSLLADVVTESKRKGQGLSEETWLGDKDETFVMSATPYAGDLPLALYEGTLPGGALAGKGNIRAILIALPGPFEGHAKFSLRRVRDRVVPDWLNEKLKLRASNEPGSQPVIPTRVAPDPTEKELAQIPEGMNIWRDIKSITFHVCEWQGTRVKLQPLRVQALEATGVASIHDRLEELVAKHTAEYEASLAHVAEPCGAALSNPAAAAARQPAPLEDANLEAKEEGASEQAADLTTYESEAKLKETVKLSGEFKAEGDKSLMVFVSFQTKQVFLMAKNFDTIAPKDLILGSVGGGVMSNRDPDRLAAIPWSFPLGDKTMIEIKRSWNEEKQFKTMTLHQLAKELCAKIPMSLKLSCYGDLIAEVQNGAHTFKFQYPEDSEGHTAVDLVPTDRPNKNGDEPKVTAANGFKGFASRGSFGEGVLMPLWRIEHQSVGNKLAPRNVMVALSKAVPLKKQCPVCVAFKKP